MTRIDLQIQTTFSDGRNTPEKIAHMAKEAGIDCYAITDHDTVAGIASALIAGEKEGVTVIPGVEFSVNFHDKTNHILGLGIDHRNDELLYVVEKQMEARKKAAILAVFTINQKLSAEGSTLIDVENFSTQADTAFSLPGLARYLFEHGHTHDLATATSHVSGTILYDFPLSVGEAVEAIHRSGGVAIISHPLSPRISLKSITSEQSRFVTLLEELRSDGVDGLEISSTGHSEAENSFLREVAIKEDFLLTFGSDWHGTLEETGETIKNYLPYYDGKFTGIEINEVDMGKIRSALKIV